MEARRLVRISACIFLIFLLSSSLVSANECSLVVGQSTTLEFESSPGIRPGTSVVCERLKICGLSRLKDLRKISHTVKVKVSLVDFSTRLPNVEVCFHRNTSLGLGMCPQGQWTRVKVSWVRYMSPFDHKLLDIRMNSLPLGTVVVSTEEEFLLYRVIFMVLGLVLMTVASSLSKSLVFYYSSAMVVGVVLVILMILFQGMKLLPTGRKSSLAIFLYSSAVGLGSFLLSYFPKLLRSALVEMGIDKEMYIPLEIFLALFVVLAGAWLGFWVVHKVVLAEDGTIDTSTSHFVAWSMRILAAVLLLQSSLDPLLAVGLLLFGIFLSLMLRKFAASRFFHHLLKSLIKTFKSTCGRAQDPDLYYNRHPQETGSPEYSNFFKRWAKIFTLASSSSPIQGSDRTPPSQLSDSGTYHSTFHTTPERRKFSKEEWQKFSKDYTKKALEELVSSPEFSKWAVANAERITLTPNKEGVQNRRRRWLPWL